MHKYIAKNPRVKYGYILDDDYTLDDEIKNFYKATTFVNIIDNDISIDPFNTNYLRIEIPEDMKVIRHFSAKSDNHYYTIFKDCRKKVRDLNPQIVYRVDRGFRVNTRLTRLYKNGLVENVEDIFHNRIEMTGTGRTRAY